MKTPKTIQDLKKLVGLQMVREDVAVNVGTISIQSDGRTYIHPEGATSFGWTFLYEDGKFCGNWKKGKGAGG